jgi:hypothetical protein
MNIETIIQGSTLLGIMTRFLINLIVLFILIRLIYYRFTKKEEFIFAYFMMGIIINLLCSLMGTVDVQIGMVLGLFAVFAILRFRTVTFTVKDMTYIFIVIGMSVVNSQANIPPPFLGAIVVNSIVIIAVLILEMFLKKNMVTSFRLKYKKVELLDPYRRSELLKDLSQITGQDVVKVTIRELNASKGRAELEVFFREKKIDKEPTVPVSI